MTDSYKLTKQAVEKVAQTTRIVLGTVPESRQQTRARQAEKQGLKRGTLDGSLTATGTQTVSVTYWDGSSWVDSGDNITSVRSGIPNIDTIASGKVVWITFQAGTWFVISAEC